MLASKSSLMEMKKNRYMGGKTYTHRNILCQEIDCLEIAKFQIQIYFQKFMELKI